MNEVRIQARTERRARMQHEGQIDDGRLPAYSSMHYYCKSCGILVATLPENWWRDEDKPPKFCADCQLLMDAGQDDGVRPSFPFRP